MVLRSAQGQQGAVLSDAGFNIDASHSFYVAAEDTANSPNKVIVTDFNLEGVTINPPGGGQIQLDYDTQGSTNMGITAVINPSGAASVNGTFSTDGTNAGTTMTDANGGLHYTYGGGRQRYAQRRCRGGRSERRRRQRYPERRRRH